MQPTHHLAVALTCPPGVVYPSVVMLQWKPSTGRGRVYTFTVTHRTQARGFRDELPYVLAWIELEEDVQVMSNIVGVDPARITIGMPLKVIFEDVKEGLSIPKFTAAG